VRTRVRRVLSSLFLPPTTTKRRKQSNPPKHTTHPIQSYPSTPREKYEKKPPSCYFHVFVVVWVTWMSFAYVARESRRGTLIMLETHTAMSSLIFYFVLLLVLCLASLMEIAHMVLVHKRTTLCSDALVMAHVLIVVVVSRVGMVFLLEDLTITLSLDTWMVHISPIVVHVLLVQMVRCKGL
jgi:hypothetical protein